MPIPTVLLTDMSFEQKVKTYILCLVKGEIDGPWVTWAMFPNDVKDDIWNKLLKVFSFPNNDLARIQFDKYVKQTYKNTIHIARRNACKKAKIDLDKMNSSVIPFNPSWISPPFWKDMVDFWIKDERWHRKSTTGKINRNRKKDFMVYHGGAKSMAAHKDAMDKKFGRDTSRAKVYLKVHTDKKTNKIHPIAESRMKIYKNKRLASMREHGIEIPMSQTTDRTASDSQPLYVGEDDELWMETVNHKKGRIPGFGKIQPYPMLSTRNSNYKSTTTSQIVDQFEAMKTEIAKLHQADEARNTAEKNRQNRFIEMQKEMQEEMYKTINREREEIQNILSRERQEMRDMMMRLMGSQLSTSPSNNTGESPREG